MKKLLIILLMGISLVGCGNTANKNETADETVTIDSQDNVEISTDENTTSNEIVETEYLNEGEKFLADTEKGQYEFTVLSAEYLGVHSGDTNNDQRLKITFEIDNISFNGRALDSSGNEVETGCVAIEARDLKVKDDSNYILEVMSTGWDNDMTNYDVDVAKGEKAIKTYTWKLRDVNTEYVYISFSRMTDENKEFKVKVNR